MASYHRARPSPMQGALRTQKVQDAFQKRPAPSQAVTYHLFKPHPEPLAVVLPAAVTLEPVAAAVVVAAPAAAAAPVAAGTAAVPAAAAADDCHPDCPVHPVHLVHLVRS